MTPASWRSQSICRPAAVKMRSTASVTSGPIPSPGMSVMVWDILLVRSSQFAVRSSRLAVGSKWLTIGQGFGEQGGHLLEQRAIARPERRGLVAVDVDLPEHLGALHDRHDNFRLRVDAARQVPRIRVHIVHDDSGFFGGGGAADTVPERDARVGRGFAQERTEHELLAVEHVDADPRVVRDRVLEQPDRLLHRGVRIRRRGDRGSNRDEQLVPVHVRHFLPGGFAPPDPPYTLAGGGPMPRAARVARSLTLTRVHLSYSLISQKMSISPPTSGTSRRA